MIIALAVVAWLILAFFAAGSFFFSAVAVSKVRRTEQKVDGLRRAMAEIGGRTAPPPTAPDGEATAEEVRRLN